MLQLLTNLITYVLTYLLHGAESFLRISNKYSVKHNNNMVSYLLTNKLGRHVAIHVESSSGPR